MTEQYVIVGAGLAGAKAAETLRSEGFTGTIVIVGDEPVRPYERPPLSKNVLLGTAAAETAFVHPLQWYGENDVDLRTGVTATGINRNARAVDLSDGSHVHYDKLLLATGSSPRQLDLDGADLDGVVYLRTMAQSEALRARLTPGTRVVIAGAGWIGLEVAAAARAAGAEVTIVEMGQLPLQRVLGDEVGAVFADLHRAHGVTFRFGCTIREIHGTGSIESVVITGDEVLPADLLVAGVGVLPNTALAEQAGLTIDNGIRVDERMRTSDERIFAAGDVANADHPLIGTAIRVEHWANALNGGPVAARAMLGQEVSFDRIPYFFTDQYDLGCEYAGYTTPSRYDEVVFRGDPTVNDGKAPEFIAFWLSDGRVLAAMNVNVWDVQDDMQNLIRAGYSGRAVDASKLADPSVPLGDLVVG